MTDTKPHPLAGLSIEQILEMGRTQRKLRSNLTPEELKRLQEYGSVEFQSAGATRKR